MNLPESKLGCACCDEVSDDLGILDLDEDGLCDSCREHQELIEATKEDRKRELDFDFSLNG